ncbi:MAG: RNA polymerase sigma factor [Candidatus Saccharimonadales bacterium]
MAASIATQVLVGQIQQGDRAALEEFCRRYQQRVLAAVRARLGAELRRKIESWDLVQEVMIEAVRRLDGFDFRSEDKFLNYLNQIVEHRIRDAIRMRFNRAMAALTKIYQELDEGWGQRPEVGDQGT